MIRTHWFLILDRHSNYLILWFNQFCIKHKIVPLCMLSHFLHILQPLDIGCFSIFKCLYSCQVEQFMRLSINHIDKLDFLILYKQVCTEIYKEEIICNAFKATELILYDSIQVLLQLYIETKTSTFSDSIYDNQSFYLTPKTPQNLQQLKH